jgi:anti-sigma regulatory factor (Ser/Thr protein kinase)
MVESAPLSVTIPAQLHALEGIRSALRRWLRVSDIRGTAAEEIVLAAWEACANAIVHPVGTTGDSVTLTAHLTGGRVRIEVQDTGHWRERAASGTGGGLGLRLVAGLMDQVAVLGGGAGTRVVMWATPARPPAE